MLFRALHIKTKTSDYGLMLKIANAEDVLGFHPTTPDRLSKWLGQSGVGVGLP